jgi:hypothetical protein
MRRLTHIAVLALLFTVFFGAREARAYSVLAHEAIVDAAWDEGILPLLKQRFSRATEADVKAARAYAYGGAIIQDLGYYPFGSHFFTDLVHYVRAGDFVEALLRDARNVNELAFAAGALAHYASDNAGHPLAVNRVVPLVYPKDRAKFGDEVLYAESPRHHLMSEFAFDVLQVSQGAYVAEAYHAFIGFEVATDLLERAFLETYGVKLGELFLDESLAIGTYRWAVGTLIPEMTRLAWHEKRDEIQKATPGVSAAAFVYRFERREFEEEFGNKYRRPGFLSRVLMFFVKVLPKVGPFRSLAFRPLTPEGEHLFVLSAERARADYLAMLRDVRNGRRALANTDFDTGKRPTRGVNDLADKTYVELTKRLVSGDSNAISPDLRRELARFYGRDPFSSVPTTVTQSR